MAQEVEFWVEGNEKYWLIQKNKENEYFSRALRSQRIQKSRKNKNLKPDHPESAPQLLKSLQFHILIKISIFNFKNPHHPFYEINTNVHRPTVQNAGIVPRSAV